jgi:hypothetical protein
MAPATSAVSWPKRIGMQASRMAALVASQIATSKTPFLIAVYAGLTSARG